MDIKMVTSVVNFLHSFFTLECQLAKNCTRKYVFIRVYTGTTTALSQNQKSVLASFIMKYNIYGVQCKCNFHEKMKTKMKVGRRYLAH